MKAGFAQGHAALFPAAILVALALCATGCAGAGSSPRRTPTSSAASGAMCSQINDKLVGAVQHYVDGYGAPLTTAQARSSAAASGPDDRQLQNALQSAEQAVRSSGCDMTEFRSRFDAGLSRIATHGPVARAVLLRLTASLTGTAAAAPATVTVRPSEDLQRRLADLATGSVVRLVAGTYRLDSSLVLLAGVTIQGAGRDRTSLLSTASDAGILVLTDERVELRDLTVRHDGKATGDLVVAGPTSSLVLTAMRVSGARAAKSTGGNGVLMTSPNGTATKRGTTLQVTDATFDNNAAAGILLTGGHVASIQRARFQTNGECGVCFAGTSTGAVRNSAFVDNRVGAAVLDHAKPALVADTFAGGVVGLQASGQATPVVQGARISGASRAAMIFADRSAGTVDNSTCANAPYDIVVSPQALPWLGHNSCTLAHGQ